MGILLFPGKLTFSLYQSDAKSIGVCENWTVSPIKMQPILKHNHRSPKNAADVYPKDNLWKHGMFTCRYPIISILTPVLCINTFVLLSSICEAESISSELYVKNIFFYWNISIMGTSPSAVPAINGYINYRQVTFPIWSLTAIRVFKLSLKMFPTLYSTCMSLFFT